MPEAIGRYRVISQLGRGGMGVVFEAEQDNPRRTVALKVVTTGVMGDQMRRRFELEAQVLGHLQHPCIAQVYEAGLFESAGGAQPFFAMELIRGKPLVDYATENGLDTRERLALIARVCDGVQHAHHRGVIHRDLKPENILVDKRGQPKILDFGLARATDSDIQVSTMHTDIGQIMGTIPYMSPEQASGDPAAIDARSDVYAMGVIAYELVTGAMPYSTDDPNPLEALRVVREEDAKPLSSINRSLRGDIDTIIGKALEKERDRRYPTAAALAEDIRRHLDDQPIAARRPSAGYQLRKFARRNKALVSGVVAVFLALVIGLIGTARGFLLAEEEAQRASSTADFFQTILGSIDPAIAQGADTTLLRGILDDTASRIGDELGGLPLVAASIHETMASAYYAISEFESALEQSLAARALYVDVVGEASVDVIRVRQREALSLMRLGRINVALSEADENLVVAEATLGTEHRLTHSARSVVGNIHLEDRRYDEAGQVFEEVLAYCRSHFPPDAEELLVAINCLGLVRNGQGRFEESEELLREAFEGRKRFYGEAHPETLTQQHNLAATFYVRQRFDEAEELYRAAFEGALRVRGEDHELTQRSAVELAKLLREMSRFEESAEILIDVFERKSKMHGPDDPRTLDIEISLANLYRRMGEHDLSMKHAEHAAAGTEAWYGPDHPATLNAKFALCRLILRNDDVEAEPLLLDLVDGFAQHYGDGHRENLPVLEELAELYRRTGRVDQAEELFHIVLAGRREIYGERHSETLMVAANLGLLYHNQGRADDAMPLHADFVVGWSDHYGDEHAYVHDIASKMLYNLALVERYGPHLESVRHLAEHYVRLGQGESTEAATCRIYEAQALIELERLDEAEAALDTAARDFETLGEPPSGIWFFVASQVDIVSPEEALDPLLLDWEDGQFRSPRDRSRIALRLASLHDALERPDEAAFWRDEAAALAD